MNAADAKRPPHVSTPGAGNFDPFGVAPVSEVQTHEHEAFLAAVLEQLPVGVGVTDKSGAWRLRNRHLLEFELNSSGTPSPTSPRGPAPWRARDDKGGPIPSERGLIQRALRGETIRPGVEMRFTRDDGRERRACVCAVPLRDGAGEIAGALVTVQDIGPKTRPAEAPRESEERRRPAPGAAELPDITERKPVEASLRQALAREEAARAEAEAARSHFRSLFESAPGLYLVLNADTLEIVGVSEAYLRATMTSREEIVGRPVFEVFPDDPNDPAATGERELRASLNRVRQQRRADAMAVQRYPIRRPREKGGGFEERYWSPINTPLVDPSGRVAFIIHRVEDVTEYVRMKQQEGAWTDRRALSSRAEQMEAEIVMRSRELKQAEDAVRQSEERLRFMAESMPQKIFTAKADGGFDYLNQEWMKFTGLAFEEIRDGGWSRLVHPDDVEETTGRWKHSVASGEYLELEHRFRRKDGVYRWHLSRAHAMRGENGEVTMWIGSNTDIDEQKRAEEQLEKAVAERTAKLRETIGELEAFSYSIAHDMRAPLRSLTGFSDLLLAESGDKLDPEGQGYLRRIAAAAGRMDKLIQDVLDYSRVVRTDPPLEPVDPGELLRGIADTYPMLSPDKADLVLEGPFPRVLGNEALLTQVFSNLLGNAVKFVPPGIKPRVRVWAEEHDDRVRVSFEDNGIGIPARQHERIFRIFERGGHGYEGTGIGLAIVKKAVERMGGKVALESEPGRGSRFWIEVWRARRIVAGPGQA